MPAREVDRQWFMSRIESLHGSARKFAAQITTTMGTPSDIGRVSRLLSGKQAPTVPEVLQFAELLGQDVLEVMRRFGYKVPRSRN